MSNNSTTLISAIKTRAALVLGLNYTELAYAHDLTKNSFKGNAKKYSVIPLASQEVSTNLRTVTLDQQFELIISDSFINTSMSDSNEQLLSSVLQDLAYDIYVDLITSKAGSTTTVIMVSNLNIDKTERITDNALVVKARFNIKYRTNF